MQKKERSCTGLHHPFHHPKTLRFGKVQSFFFLCFLSAHRYDRNLLHNIRLTGISLKFCYKMKNSWRHEAIAGDCFIQRLAQLQGLLPLAHQGPWSLRCFFAVLLPASVRAVLPSHLSLTAMGAFSLQNPKFWLPSNSVLFGAFPLREMCFQSILLQILSRHMWPWFATSLQLHFWIWSICSVERAKVITAGNHSSELQISIAMICQ